MRSKRKRNSIDQINTKRVKTNDAFTSLVKFNEGADETLIEKNGALIKPLLSDNGENEAPTLLAVAVESLEERKEEEEEFLETDCDSDDNPNLRRRGRPSRHCKVNNDIDEETNDVDNENQQITAVQAQFNRINRVIPRSEIKLYDFSKNRQQIREISGVTRKLMKKTIYIHQQTLLHKVIKDMYINHDQDFVDISFSWGLYGGGIVRVFVQVYSFENREHHLRLWKDRAEEIPADHQRYLWVLYMSRKPTKKTGKINKSINKAGTTSPESEESGCESSSPSEDTPQISTTGRPLRKCRLRLKDSAKTDDITNFGKGKTSSSVMKTETNVLSVIKKEEDEEKFESANEEDDEKEYSARSELSSSSESDEDCPPTPEVFQESFSDDGISDVLEEEEYEKANKLKRKNEVKKSFDNETKIVNIEDLKNELIDKALQGVEESNQIESSLEKQALVDNEQARRMREEHGGKTVGVKYDDMFDPTTQNLMWFSQARDRSGRISCQIVEDFRTGNADIIFAAKSIETKSGWQILGNPEDVRANEHARFMIGRNERVIRTVGKGSGGKLKLHRISTTSKIPIPACSESNLKRKPVIVVYDGLVDEDLEERRQARLQSSTSFNVDEEFNPKIFQTLTNVTDPILSEHRMVTLTKESKFIPSDGCCYCGWKPPSLWFKIPVENVEAFSSIFIHNQNHKLNSPIRAEEIIKRKSKTKAIQKKKRRQDTLDTFVTNKEIDNLKN